MREQKKVPRTILTIEYSFQARLLKSVKVNKSVLNSVDQVGFKSWDLVLKSGR